MVMGVFRRTLWMFLLLLCDVSFLGFADQDYGVALEKTLLFFEAQRSGKLPNNQRVKWRGDSGLSDGKLQGVDLVGGYYDAGDHMKFGLPMAFTVTMLSWAAVDFSEDIKDAYQMSNALYSIKWGTDYFLKAHTQPTVLWGQVGEGDSDHYCWLRPEDMTKSRPAFKIDSRNPGSDLAAETAAALAAASLAFKPYNSTYSFKLKRHAEQLFEFADSHRGVYDDSIKDAADFYSSSGYQDELLWSAAWLYRATEKEYYLKYLVDNAESMGGIGWGVKEFSWDNKYAGLQILITKIVSDVVAKHKGGGYISTLNKYKAKADFFACACLQKNNGGANNNVRLTPAGLIYVRQWNNLQYVSSASFLLAIYSQYLTQTNSNLNCPADSNLTPNHLLKFAKTQTDYILGKNPKSISYLIGYSSKYPTQVHHRGASIPSKSILHSPVGCVQGFDQWYNRRQPNPNVLHGGLVGGPDQNDNFDDDRSEYEQTEPTITGTAPLLGLFAKLRSSYGGSTTTYKKPPSPPTYKPYNKPSLPHSYTYHAGAPLKFAHSITAQWMFKGEKYYRHAVVVKNISSKGARIRNVKLKIRNLTGPIYGVVKVNGAVYAVPGYLKPGSEFVFVYIQGGPRAKVSVYSFQK